MQSHQDSFGSVTLKNRGHRRSDSLGKSMPITSLLLHYTPSSLQISDNIRSDAGTGNISPTQQEVPPMYFPICDIASNQSVTNVKNSSDQNPRHLDTDDELDVVEQEYEILVSECSSNNGYSDEEEDRRKSNSEEYISLIGNSKFYAPCMTCVGSAPTELTSRPSAINEICRRLCTEECRLRLSLAGLVTPSDKILNNRELLEEYVRESLEKIKCDNNDVPPNLPPRPVKETEGKGKPPLTLPLQPPGNIAIQRKKFLTDILMQNENLSSDDEEMNKQQPPKELLDIATNVVVHPSALPPPPTSSPATSPLLTKTTTNLTQTQDIEAVDDDIRTNVQICPHEMEMIKDFREKLEIAEALAKTSAMTSTSKIKQRLAARKLEIELEMAKKNASSINSGNTNASANSIIHVRQGDEVGVEYNNNNNEYTSLENTDNDCDIISCSNAIVSDKQGVPDAVTTQTNFSHKLVDTSSPYYDSDYEPPREILLYLIRMGSFNSGPKFNNSDTQDDNLEIPQGLSTSELLQHCRHLRGEERPPLLTRFFFKSLSTVTSNMASPNMTTDRLSCLELRRVSQACSVPIADPNYIRLLQWNLLSQTLGQNNDGFVRCPEEALTWGNRKFLIIQEILQNNPDIICLQEVDHFKFLKKTLGTQNYEGIFFPKPDSPCLYFEDNNGPDGCAIFFKRDKFELINFETRVLEVYRTQSNQVAIAANLKIKVTDREICVSTTHLKAREGGLLSKLRNEQGRDFVYFAKNLAGDRPLLLCGDFNAEPTEPVYSTILNFEFLKLSSAYSDIRAEINRSSTTEQLEHCDNVQKSIQNEPPYTTWKIRDEGEICHTIDYVFYTKDKLKVKNCLAFPQDDEIGENRTPSLQYPSDHFSLVCDFKIIDHQESDDNTQKKM